MADPISITRGGHKTYFKWHRARRRFNDPMFTGKRILEGMALGASVEVDLVVTGDKGFAVLHDQTLDRETTGTGVIGNTSDAVIRRLHLRDNDGAPLGEPVMLLEDLCSLLARGTAHPEALLQLDFKEDETVLDARAIENFSHAIKPLARTMIVSSEFAQAVKMLSDAVPGIRIGYDPSDERKFKAALRSSSLGQFVADANAASPDADMIYLGWEMVTVAADAGFDIVDAFHEQGKRIDAWTIGTVDDASVAVVERLLALKVDQITTDDPEGLSDALSRR